MRTRTRGYLTPIQSSIQRTNSGCVSNFTETFVDCGSIGKVKTTIDVVTPNYAKRRRNGEIIINPFSTEEIISEIETDGPDLVHSCAGVSNPVHPNAIYVKANRMNQRVGPNPYRRLFTGSEVGDLVDIAATSCWSSLHKEEAQLLVFLAELKRTVSMLRAPLANVQSFLAKVRSAKNSSKLASSKSLTTGQYLAREWLTYRFGWSQLYRDVFNVLKALEKEERTGLQRAFGQKSDFREDTQLGTDTSFSSLIDPHYQIYTTHLVKVRCGIYYTGSRSTNDYLGISPESFVDAAWELVPYSFVVDWVVGVQPYLRGLIRSLSVPTLGSFTTVNETISSIVTWTGSTLTDTTGLWSITKDVSGTSSIIKRTKVRTKGIPPPRLKFELKIEDILDLRVLDSLALIVNALGRR